MLVPDYLPFPHEGHLNSVYSLSRCPQELHFLPGNILPFVSPLFSSVAFLTCFLTCLFIIICTNTMIIISSDYQREQAYYDTLHVFRFVHRFRASALPALCWRGYSYKIVVYQPVSLLSWFASSAAEYADSEYVFAGDELLASADSVV